MALFGKKKKKGAEDAAPVTPEEGSPKKKKETEEAVPAAPKPRVRPDVYTLLLGLSVAALLVAVVLLYLNIAGYGASPLSGIPKA